ncbi:AraC family transcriptional regulator [Flavobacterium sp. N1736]|uniref:AraC family transcriptional regulator n=1 Tax=Flavobacterium sp. N1736 TaxID=2986823 RepID=UPI002225AF2A|nr:helix-turn-helix domain-containing protein [Flavobacterium sp. N1736]
MSKQHFINNHPDLSNEKSLKTLVENRTIYTLSQCELNIFETYECSRLVPLKFNDFVVTSMLKGKKIMHLFDDPAFDYLPGETVIIPSNVEMKIDFPEASEKNPTQCLALAIDKSKITNTLIYLNENYPKENHNEYWNLDYQNYYFYNNADLATTINKLLKECMSTSITKDALADLALKELLIRIIQTQNLKSLDNGTLIQPNNLIFEMTEFIKLNLKGNINLKSLSEKACMSTVSFYRFFKRELGMSPIEYILKEKIKHAKKLLQNPELQINEICYLSGFVDANYFTRVFKKHEGITPKQYKTLHVNNLKR